MLEDPSSKFLELFQVTIIVAHGNILRSMPIMLGANRLLAIVKDIGGLHLIVIGEMFFRLISHSIVLQLWGSFQEHLSPH